MLALGSNALTRVQGSNAQTRVQGSKRSKAASSRFKAQQSCWFNALKRVQGSKFKEKQAADYKNFTQICSVAAGLKFKV